MAECKVCGNTINFDEIKDYCIDYNFNYDEVSKDLCIDCFENARNMHENGVIFDICDKCGKRFDVCEDEVNLENEAERQFGLCDMDLIDIWNNDGRILCVKCALEDYVSPFRDKLDRDNDNMF